MSGMTALAKPSTWRGKPVADGGGPTVARPGRVVAEVYDAGVCHIGLRVMDGEWPARRPVVLNHEGAGIVRRLGEGVDAA